jgi:hypothetical protein
MRARCAIGLFLVGLTIVLATAKYEEALSAPLLEAVETEAVAEYAAEEEQTEDAGEISDLLQTEAKPYGLNVGQTRKSCGQRKQEVVELLRAFGAAKLLAKESPHFGVQDRTTTQLISTWEGKYKTAVAEHAFYCTQTDAELEEIAAAVRIKQKLAVEVATKAGVAAAKAAIKKKRKMAEQLHKKHVEKNTKEVGEKKRRRQWAQDQTDKIASEAIQKNLARLRKLPQITRHLYGKVLDATTGQALSGCKIKTSCLFKTTSTSSRKSGMFTLSDGITGPAGRQCDLFISKEGYAPSSYPITVIKSETDSEFRFGMLFPEVTDNKKYRFVLQYGANPDNLDAHVLVPTGKTSWVDLAEAALSDDNSAQGQIKYGHLGSGAASPFTTVDHTARRFGPEAITVHQTNDGSYHFFVVNAAQSYTTPLQFRKSKARAFLYQGNQLLKTVAINSAAGDATQIWDVFVLNCMKAVCSLKTRNEFVGKPPMPNKP